MDLTAQIKENLISRIRDSKDMNFLKALQTIFDSSEQALYELNVEQESSIETSRNQIKKGRFHKNEDVISEMKEWLKKK
jgi:predicted transcriptional regulator